jgi:hypothetical protein
MSDPLRKAEALFALAKKADRAPPLDTAAVMRGIERRLAALPPRSAGFAAPIRLLVGISSLAAALAAIVAGLAASVLANLDDPLRLIAALPDVTDFLRI